MRIGRFIIVDVYLYFGFFVVVVYLVGVVYVLIYRVVFSRGDRIFRGYRVRWIVDIYVGYVGGDRGGIVI